VAYYLLTGATGLLGRYLLRNLLLCEIPTAVVVRPTRLATAQQRIESAVGEIEETLGHALTRPVVLEGELNEPGLGLPAESRGWIRRHVRGIIHNAASLSFQTAQPQEEPWLTNVTGTRNVLEAARAAGVRELHHVSTAYVCGLRSGVVREDELDIGQQLGNDYERSKLAAEQLVRGADWLRSVTIYRPAIIVGDSRTYFSNTFHGFYTPLKIVHAAINKLSLREVQPRSLVEILGLSGDECKNLVPVDWVAEAMLALLADERHHGRVYHLTADLPTPVSLLCEVFNQSVRAYSIDWQRAQAAPASQSFAAFQSLFKEQMEVYRSYWRDDPQFDATNRLAALPDLRCPMLDERTLSGLCRFAIESKFWWSRGTAQDLPLDVPALLRQRLRPMQASAADARRSTVGLIVAGAGGGQWQLELDSQRPVAYEPGCNRQHAALHLHVEVLRSIGKGRLNARDAVACGAVMVEGNGLSQQDAVLILQQLAGSTALG
jgi:thioester reductase-like protein